MKERKRKFVLCCRCVLVDNLWRHYIDTLMLTILSHVSQFVMLTCCTVKLFLEFVCIWLTLTLRKRDHAIYRDFLSAVKIENLNGNFLIFLIFMLTTDNLCFESKIRKIDIYPCIPQFYCIKVGYNGVFITRTCFPDDCN